MDEVAQRFYMLAVFVWASALQATTWPPIAAAPHAAKYSFPGLSDDDILWQLNFGPIAQMIAVPVALKMLSGCSGLQRCVRLGVFFAILSAAIRFIAVLMPWTFRQTAAARWLIHIAGMACGISGGFLQGCPSRFSAVWFPPHQRTRSTGCAFVGLGLGQAVCYAVCPLLIRNDKQLLNLLTFQLLLAVPALSCYVYFPERPSHAWWLQHEPSSRSFIAAEGDTERTTATTNSAGRLIYKLMRQPSVCLLAVMCSLANGPYQAWGAALPTILDKLNYTASQNDLFSFGSLFAYTIGCYVVGELGDRVFKGRLKTLLSLLILAALLCFIWLCLMLPTSYQPVPVIDADFPVVLVAVALTGWFVGATNPICMELCAEISYPVPEGVSGNIIIFITQVFTVILLAVVPHLDSLLTTPLMAVLLLICGLLVCPAEGQYRRTAAEMAVKNPLVPSCLQPAL